MDRPDLSCVLISLLAMFPKLKRLEIYTKVTHAKGLVDCMAAIVGHNRQLLGHRLQVALHLLRLVQLCLAAAPEGLLQGMGQKKVILVYFFLCCLCCSCCLMLSCRLLAASPSSPA